MSLRFDPEDARVHDDLHATCRAQTFASSGVEESRVLLPMMIYMERTGHDPLRGRAPLARLEVRGALEELLGRSPDCALEKTPRWAQSRWARSHPAIRVRLRG